MSPHGLMVKRITSTVRYDEILSSILSVGMRELKFNIFLFLEYKITANLVRFILGHFHQFKKHGIVFGR